MPSRNPILPKPELAASPEVLELPLACASEEAAVELIERNRWGDCPCCAHCGSVNVYKMVDRKTGQRNKRFLWRCRDCAKQYTVRVGTIYGDSAIPLHKWVRAMWEGTSCKNGVSALEMSRKLQITYKSALFLMHRIRWGMQTGPGPKLRGTVELDTTYIGGKPRNKGAKAFPPNARGKGTKKQPVIAIIDRNGNVRTEVVATVNAKNIEAFVKRNVDTDKSRLHTDEDASFGPIGKTFAGGHERVNHKIMEYARGDVTTNRAEGFFARCKRSLYGVHHAVSVAHLPRYLSGWQFSHGSTRLTDGQRVHALMQANIGKHLSRAQYRAQAG